MILLKIPWVLLTEDKFTRCCTHTGERTCKESGNSIENETAFNYDSNSISRTQLGFQTLFRLRNDLYCVGWGVKLDSLTHSLTHFQTLQRLAPPIHKLHEMS